MGKFRIILVAGILFYLGFLSCGYSEEQLTITTYYPSPYGSYRELTWGNFPNTRGYLKADQGSSIELGGSGTPYIDFSNDMVSDYDARLTLLGDNELAFQGITRINTCVRVPYVSGTTYCPSCYYVSSFQAAPTGDMICCMINNPASGSGC